VVNQSRKRYPLQIAIGTLFITITVILAVILSWQSFNKTSDIMLNDAREIYQRITRELALDFKATYGSIFGELRQFRLSPIVKAKTFTERNSYLENFQALLESDPSIFAASIAYKNGDYLSVALTNTNHIRELYHPPAGAALMSTYIKNTQSEPGFNQGYRYLFFYDADLNEISRRKGKETQYDPRNRDWYKKATDIPQATKPYIFFDSKIIGLTAMSTSKEPGVVVMFDITLENLSQTIAKYYVTPRSEVLLINAEGQTFAYKDQEKIIAGKDPAIAEDLQLADLSQLGSGVLSHVSTTLEAKEQDLDFEFDGQRWIGSARIVARPGDVDLYALMLSPVEELLAEAIAIRWQLIFIALIVLLIFIPVIWLTAKRISTPLHKLANDAEAISRFEFDETRTQSSFIKEVDALDSAMDLMKSTINKFIKLINSLAGEQDLDALLKSITKETMAVSHSDAALIYLVDEQDDLLKAHFLCDKNIDQVTIDSLPVLTLVETKELLASEDNNKSRILNLMKDSDNKLSPLLELLNTERLLIIVIPLQNRNNEIIGMLCLIYQTDNDNRDINTQGNIDFVEALSGFAAVTLESRQLFNMQEALLHSFIKLIAGAIDAKSPYTGGHCQRVPEITLMMAKAACESNDTIFKDFDLDEKQWEELNIACWLHDCGKVTTPEYVVDKATKLETIYDRIHEVRMRFEVLKRDAEIECWQAISEGGNRDALLDKLKSQQIKIDKDFAFVAECNIGSEYMDDKKIARLHRIAETTWIRTLDDNSGLSWEELNRKNSHDVSLPAEEKLLADKPEHLIKRQDSDQLAKDNPWGFKVDTPEHKYNRGELYNLCVQRGTLSEEERYMINGHMIQTIKMLNNLPYPRYLRNVPLIAGSHHETMDGTGYPRRLLMGEQPLTSRMMVIADIFEALTASDRPYKKAKTLNESIRILSYMRNDNHIDPDLFTLFLTSGIYLEYAKKFLSVEQIDEVNIDDYLSRQ
jgi:HD-GYP domain-containing protein (c-di-GMP phosphodiesterase class II)